MTEQHTPGPWYVKGATILPEAPSFNWIAAVQVKRMPEWEANAHLIAASPKLLKALESAADELDSIMDWHGYGSASVLRDARAAINEAKGIKQ
jgi:hypothetical protein